MSTVCRRSGLIENDDIPSSYLPPWMPGMMPGKALFWNSAVSPSFCATAVPRSMSMPSIVVPSGPVNSVGGYDASVPNTILPSAETLCGTFAASASTLAWVGTALGAAGPCGVGGARGAGAAAPADVGAAEEPLPSPPAPHPARTAVSAAQASAAGSVRGSDTDQPPEGRWYAGMLPLSVASGPPLCICCYLR